MGKKPRVLIVDDEKYIVNALIRALIDEEFEIYSTTDSNKAIKLIDSINFDIILCDQKMDGQQGIDILDYCRRISPDTIRILITGYADINVMADAINKCHIHYYISKPWNNKELVNIINKNLSNKKMINRKEELVSYILNHKEHFEKIVDGINSIKGQYDDISLYNSDENKAQKSMNRIAVKKDESIVLLNPSDIYYLAARNGKVLIFTKNDLYYSWDSMKSWVQKLSSFNFIKCHRSYIVNVDKIEEIIPWFNGTYNLKLKDIPEPIYASKIFIKNLKERFNIDSDNAK
ncbi:MAG: LytTR family transcriptional regulator DNA-binding domain-containing protein [Acetivibrionales bacterium]